MSNEIGKTLSFFQLMNQFSLKIEIPIIQRDYAQGRDNAVEIRTNFLKTVKKHLDLNQPLNLDFVYGSIENDRFIPIDGQQRLTTLFLLHWYLALVSGNEIECRNYLGVDTSNFSYETRISSRDFCKRLVTESLNRNESLPIGALLRNQEWFYLNWMHDATITGMLNTLDSIEQIFTEPEHYYGLLTDTQPSLVTFQYIELKDFGLSDQLYIKMNSRGKPLTEFENLKANLEQIFEEHDKRNSTQYTAWLTSKIDGIWTDVFWSFLQNKSLLIDDLFINFLRASVINLYALEKDETDNEHLKLLLDSSKPFTFYMLETVDFAKFSPLYQSLRHFESLITESGELLRSISNVNLLDEESLFKDIIYDQTSYTKRIQLYAMCIYLTQKRNISEIEDWIRVVRNLTENSRIEDSEEFVNALRTTNRLLSQPIPVLNLISQSDPSDLVGFSNYQSREEILKAKLILSNPDWKERIHSIEDHPYLKGQIGFLLNFSGVEDAMNESLDSELDSAIAHKLMKRFDTYVERFLLVFKEDGIKDFDQFLFERALLAIGDYTLSKGRNWSFLINGTEREISWKRYLRSDHRLYLKELFDKIKEETLLADLQNIVEAFDVDDFRYYFIKYPEIIFVTGKNKFIRWYDEKNILLLEKTQTNGTHREYYSYAICCELRRKGYQVDYHPDAFEGLGSKYISHINGMEFFVSYHPSGQYEGYWIEKDGGEIQFSTAEEVLDHIKLFVPLA